MTVNELLVILNEISSCGQGENEILVSSLWDIGILPIGIKYDPKEGAFIIYPSK